MKKTTIALLLGILLLSFGACANKDQEYSYTIKDALKISAFLYDENSGEDYYVYRELAKQYDYNPNEGVFNLEQLKKNEAGIMYPSFCDMLNLTIHFKFDGIIEVISENEDVQLGFKSLSPFEPIRDTSGNNEITYGFEMKFLNEGYLAAIPMGANRGHLYAATWLQYYAGREYYLTVKAYKFDNEQSPVITARLKLVTLEDKVAKYTNEQSSGRFSIELISYEYSDVYIILDELWDDDDDD